LYPLSLTSEDGKIYCILPKNYAINSITPILLPDSN
jgi:hypothetical protein